MFAKKFAKTGKNRLFNNKKTLKSALYKVLFESFKFQTGRGSRSKNFGLHICVFPILKGDDDCILIVNECFYVFFYTIFYSFLCFLTVHEA